MEAYSSLGAHAEAAPTLYVEVGGGEERMPPVAGDFAAGQRSDDETLRARGDFASGMRTMAPVGSSLMGDFAAGLRSHERDGYLIGDFATGQRAAGPHLQG
jgi:hypothetical protein